MHKAGRKSLLSIAQLVGWLDSTQTNHDNRAHPDVTFRRPWIVEGGRGDIQVRAITVAIFLEDQLPVARTVYPLQGPSL